MVLNDSITNIRSYSKHSDQILTHPVLLSSAYSTGSDMKTLAGLLARSDYRGSNVVNLNLDYNFFEITVMLIMKIQQYSTYVNLDDKFEKRLK